MHKNEVTINDFETLRQYIKYLCKQKNMNTKGMTSALGLNHETYRSNIGRTFNLRTVVKIIDYLDGDLDIAMHLPLKKENKSTKEGKMNYDND